MTVVWVKETKTNKQQGQASKQTKTENPNQSNDGAATPAYYPFPEHGECLYFFFSPEKCIYLIKILIFLLSEIKRNSLPITSVIQHTKKETFIWIHFSLILSFYLLTKYVLKMSKSDSSHWC